MRFPSMLSRGPRAAIDYALYRNRETVLSIPGRRLYKTFVAATKDVKSTQAAVLADILNYAGETVYGREHGFASARGYDDYARRVPINDYEDLREAIDRHTRGERDVLFPGKPLMYNQSSGTTALPKLIPVTPYNFERTIRDRGKLWLYGLMQQFPGAYAGKDMTMISPAVEGHTADGTPFGSLSGLVYKNIPSFLSRVHSAPYSVYTLSDYEAKAYTVLRCALASDVSMVLTANPSTILNLVTRADTWKERLIRDIHDGTLDPEVDPTIRAELAPMLRANPLRAAVLDRFARQSDALLPSDYWPNLKLIHTWKQGNCALVIPKLKPWFRADTPIAEFGYLASEITATDLIDAETDGSILQVRSAFYEFSPYEDGGDDRGDRMLLAHELTVGQRYFVYVTTYSGLYRYDMNDVIEVIGSFGQAPVIRFLFKGKGITSLQGEKLSEEQLIEGVRQAACELAVRADFFIAYADADHQRYELLIDLGDDARSPALTQLADALDRALMAVNVEYAAKRKSARLHQPVVIDAGRNFFERYKAMRLAEGASEGQFKWLHLTSSDDLRAKLVRLSGLRAESHVRGLQREVAG
ncbi:MAG: GH3 auxin-responsive promoter family protein [Rhodospirillales bacterium]|nr:GH3 auxin-responsive promoter family protein [Rhodospirillales bacterium]